MRHLNFRPQPSDCGNVMSCTLCRLSSGITQTCIRNACKASRSNEDNNLTRVTSKSQTSNPKPPTRNPKPPSQTWPSLGEGKTAQAPTPTSSISSTRPPDCGPPRPSVLLEVTLPPRPSQTWLSLGEGKTTQAPPTPSTFSSPAASPASSSTSPAAANPAPPVIIALPHHPRPLLPVTLAAFVLQAPATPPPALPARTIPTPAHPNAVCAARGHTTPAASQLPTARCVRQAPSTPTPAPTRRHRA